MKPHVPTDRIDAVSSDLLDAGAPDALVCEDGFGFPLTAGEIKLATKGDVIVNPVLTINQKLIEFGRSNQPFPCYLGLPHDKEAKARFEAALKGAMNTPHKPLKAKKATKKKKKAK